MARIGGSAEYIHHITAITLRVDGSGSLNMTLLGVNDVRSKALKPLTMSDPATIEPSRLCNFRSQRTRFEFEITEMDEYFEISRVVFFMKTSATSYPM